MNKELSHIPLRPLKNDIPGYAHESHALFSKLTPRKAIIFIHGYKDHPIKAWQDFHKFIPRENKFKECDAYFYGYDGTIGQISSSSNLFFYFLQSLFTDTNSIIPKWLSRDKYFSYDEIIISCHSLGAVIARRALLDAVDQQISWSNKVSLLLFAPAHKGCHFLPLMAQLLQGVELAMIYYALKAQKSPYINQLSKDSQILNRLLQDTLKLTMNGQNLNLNAKAVIWAEQENVVENEHFGRDPKAITIRGKNHKSICKPKSKYIEPINLLKHLI